MKTIIYASNNFQALLCLEAAREWLEQEGGSPHQTAFNGLISLKTNHRSLTATYLHSKDTIMNFSVPKPEEDKNQLKLEL